MYLPVFGLGSLNFTQLTFTFPKLPPPWSPSVPCISLFNAYTILYLTGMPLLPLFLTLKHE